ncbi:MAG: sensor domain-containing diguanylate cyclase [Calditrichaeota bacterium]|nr:sensor domain-containing diguanylate cyclase [Calditrichota bacterium]
MQSKNPDFHLNETNVFLPCLQIGKLLTSTLDLNEILSLIMSYISHLVEASNWSLLLRHENTGNLHFEVVVGIDKKVVDDVTIPPGQGIAGLVAEKGEPIFIENASMDERVFREVDRLTGFKTRSIICIPLNTHGRTLGVIEIINVEDFVGFRKNKLPPLSILADYAAIAIENSQYLNRIRKMSITDEHTGLFNSRYMHSIFPVLIKEADRNNNCLAAVFVDIDNFKTVVDTYGHLAGSHALKEIGETIRKSLRSEDILIKYGGDEYVILLPGSNKNRAVSLIKSVQKNLRESSFLKKEKKPLRVTASFGIAVYPDDAKSQKELLLMADDSMYQIKNSGKNGIGTVQPG